MNVWVVIPARNEQKTIGSVVASTKRLYKNVVVVDDGSTDKTKVIAAKNKAIVLSHAVNLGKGAALKTGCDYAVKNGAVVLVVMDADAQHNPRDISQFLEKMKNVDIVFGYRKLDQNMPFIFKVGNTFINHLTFLLYGIKLHDTQCGFRAFSSASYRKIRWHSPDYSMESEMISNAGRYKLRYVEVPIKTVYKDRYKGTTVMDGIKIAMNMVWWKLRR